MSYDKAAPNKTSESQQHVYKHILVPFSLKSVIVSGTQDPKIIEIPISKANFQFYQTRFLNIQLGYEISE